MSPLRLKGRVLVILKGQNAIGLPSLLPPPSPSPPHTHKQREVTLMQRFVNGGRQVGHLRSHSSWTGSSSSPRLYDTSMNEGYYIEISKQGTSIVMLYETMHKMVYQSICFCYTVQLLKVLTAAHIYINKLCFVNLSF